MTMPLVYVGLDQEPIDEVTYSRHSFWLGKGKNGDGEDGSNQLPKEEEYMIGVDKSVKDF